MQNKWTIRGIEAGNTHKAHVAFSLSQFRLSSSDVRNIVCASPCRPIGRASAPSTTSVTQLPSGKASDPISPVAAPTLAPGINFDGKISCLLDIKLLALVTQYDTEGRLVVAFLCSRIFTADGREAHDESFAWSSRICNF